MKLTVSNANITNTLSTARMALGNASIVESLTLGNVSVTPSQISVGSVSITPTAVSVPALVLGGTSFSGGSQGGIINYQEFTANGTWNNPLVYTQISVSQGLTYSFYTQGSSTNPTTEAGLDALFNTATSSPTVTFGGTGIHSGTINWGDSGQTGAGGAVGTKPAYLPADQFSWMVEGYILAPETGTYFFGVDGDDAVDVFVNGVNVASYYGSHGFNGAWTGGATGGTQVSGSISLTAGQYYTFRARQQDGGGGDGIQVGWRKPSDGAIALIPASAFYYGTVTQLSNTLLTGYEQVLVMAWGGGGGGASNNTISRSGGGGACSLGYFTLANLANTVAVTVGSGGTAARTTTTAVGTAGNGGNSIFSELTAYGGGGGNATLFGGGGGALSNGTQTTGGSPLPGTVSTYGGGTGDGTTGGSTIFGGGGGFGATGSGGNSIYGGGGAAAGAISTASGNSVFGGKGGLGSGVQEGSIPAGGGASSPTGAGAGARGEVRVWVFGPAGTTAGAPTYALTANTTTLYQGSSVLYTVSTTNVANGTTLYYTLNNSSTAVSTDFTTAVNGSVIINGGTGTFTLTANNDADATNEAFTMDIRNTSTTGSIVASNGSVSIIPNVSVINRGILETATNDASSYTYTNYNIGAATSTRRVIVVAFACNGTTGSRRISSITIGGIPATIDADGFDDRGGAGVVVCTIASATVPTGTTATIVVNYTGTMSRAAMYAVAIDNLETSTPIDTSIIGSLSSPHSHSLNIRNGGFMIGGAGTDADGTTISWTNITERVESAVEGSGSRYGAADDLTNITETRSISVAIAAGARRVSALASYR